MVMDGSTRAICAAREPRCPASSTRANAQQSPVLRSQVVRLEEEDAAWLVYKVSGVAGPHGFQQFLVQRLEIAGRLLI